MKKYAKILALGLCSLFALSVFAGCGDGGKTGGNDNGNAEGNGPTGENNNPNTDLPALPTPDKQAETLASPMATYSVDGSLPSSRPTMISDDLFGVFLEDINYASHLLDDSLINNGNFQSLDGKEAGWTTSGGASLSIQTNDGVLAENSDYKNDAKHINTNPDYAHVVVNSPNGGIVNRGYANNQGYEYMPIAVKKGETYTFSAFVKATQAAVMQVSVKDNSNTTYATADISLSAKDEWVKYVKTVEATETGDKNLRIEITFNTAGSYDLDAVAFEAPSTVGIKQYAYDAIAELKPKFIRFPGGCIIEGDPARGGANTTEIYDWKNSVGAVNTGTNTGDDTVPKFTYTLNDNGTESTKESYGEYVTRTNNADLWGYNMDYGIGFYEYFLLCESLQASAVPVLNCGMSDLGGAAQGNKGIALNGRHGQKVKDYIQDAIDLMEFAKGDSSTKWGAVRIAMGHEQPFKMHYLGIGNEQFGDYYTKYYEEFLKDDGFQAALEKYEIEPIVGNGMFRSNCEDLRSPSNHKKGLAQEAAIAAKEKNIIDKISDYGVHDQHYYVNYTYLFQNYDLYDDYKRENRAPDDYYGVFVGEYSANAGDGTKSDSYNGEAADTRTGHKLVPNSLITALSEAAAMTGFERNGDVVKLAAYAPMFGVAKTSEDPTSGGDETVNQWGVDMMYFTNTEIVRTANYYVQKIFMHNQGHAVLSKSRLRFADGETEKFKLPCDGTTPAYIEVQKLYYVASVDTKGDIIIKIVNATGDDAGINFAFANAETRGFAYVTELSNSDYQAFNSLGDIKVQPVESSIGWSGTGFGYTLKPYSLTVLRIPTVPAE